MSETSTPKKSTEKKAAIVGEQKIASGKRLVAGGGSTLASGPSQDDLNPAYAPPKEDAEGADAKA